MFSGTLSWYYNVFALTSFVAAAGMLILLVATVRHRHLIPGGKYFIAMEFMVICWLIFPVLSFYSCGTSNLKEVICLEYLTVSGLPLSWFLFSASYTRHKKWLRPGVIALLAIIPALTFFFSITNDLHHLMWLSIDCKKFFGLDNLVPQLVVGPWFWVYLLHSYVMVIMGSLLLIVLVIRSPQLYRMQATALLVGCLMPLLINVVYMVEPGVVDRFDMTPFGMALGSVFIAIGVFRFRLLDVAPVGRHMAMENMQDGVVVLDSRRLIADLNPAAARLLSCTMTEAIGVPLSEIFPAASALLPLEGRNPVNGEMGFTLNVEGELRYFRLHSSKLLDRQEVQTGSLLVFYDITEKHEAHRKLKESEQRFRSLVMNSPTGIVYFNLKGEVLEVNKHLLAMFGRDSFDEIKHVNMLSYPSLVQAGVAEEARRCIERGEVVFNERSHLSERGRQMVVRYYLAPIKNEEGQVSAVLAMLEDITEQTKIEEEMLAVQKLADLGMLSAGVAHEINSPLQVIIGLSEGEIRRIEKDDFSKEDALRHFQTINRNGWRVAEIVRSLLRYARSTMEETNLNNLNEIVRDCLLLTEHQLRSWANINIKTSLGTDLPLLQCERNKISQVIINLLINARDAMPDGGEIRISTVYEEEAQRILLSISDTGEGISNDLRKKVFDPFFTTKPVDKGTGLGLSIVSGIVKTHGGEITLESELGKGTTFNIYFPATFPGGEKSNGLLLFD